MKRIIVALVLAMVLAAVTGGAALAAPNSVDPDTLTLPPPPGAECKDAGNYIICQTYFDEPSLVNEPVFELSCGTVYETSDVHREGTAGIRPKGFSSSASSRKTSRAPGASHLRAGDRP